LQGAFANQAIQVQFYATAAMVLGQIPCAGRQGIGEVLIGKIFAATGKFLNAAGIP
jgi:hypothetical protein